MPNSVDILVHAISYMCTMLYNIYMGHYHPQAYLGSGYLVTPGLPFISFGSEGNALNILDIFYLRLNRVSFFLLFLRVLCLTLFSIKHTKFVSFNFKEKHIDFRLKTGTTPLSKLLGPGLDPKEYPP